MNRFKKSAEKIIDPLDIRFDGSRSWDIQVHDERLYRRVFAQGTLGFGEAYMDGWWDSEQLDELAFRLLRSDLPYKFRINISAMLNFVLAQAYNIASRTAAWKIGGHYNIGNDLYACMLDKRMNYSCGYWKDAKNLDESQEAKLDLICRKLQLRPGMKILDIGCGWGGFAKFAAERYGVTVIGCTISKEQARLAKELCTGVAVEIILKDYRDMEGSFDRVVSIGMAEHLGYRNYSTYFKKIYSLLKEDGLALVHTIGGNISVQVNEAWIAKYIFPHPTMLPSIAQIGSAIEKLFVMEDWHNFGAYYDKTLMAWLHNFDQHWPVLKEKYDARFYRMWKYYLLMCAGSFRARKNQLWQIVLSKHGVMGGYQSIR